MVVSNINVNNITYISCGQVNLTRRVTGSKPWMLTPIIILNLQTVEKKKGLEIGRSFPSA